MDVVTLNGNRVTQARLTLPAWGVAYADVSIDGQIQLPATPGGCTLVLNDLTFVCTVLSGGPSVTGRSDYRLVGGFGGWGQEIPKLSYANDIGVKQSKILIDAATSCGEQIDIATIPQTTVGPSFVRPAGQACRILEQYAPSAWYVGEDGITRLGTRASNGVVLAIPPQAPRVTPIDRARGVVTLASDSIATILPGVTCDGLTAMDVVHETAGQGLRSTLYGTLSDATTRRLAALRKIADQFDPDRMFRGQWEYRVVTLSGNRANLQAVLTSSGMPDIQRVFIRPGVSGAKSQLALGSRVVVGFVNADPGRPVVLAYEDADGSGFLPVSTTIKASAALTLTGGATADLEAPAVTVGASAATVAIGATPLPIAAALGTVTAFGAMETFVAVLSTTIQAMAMGWSSLSPTQMSNFTAAVSAVETALTTTAAAAIPTITVTAGP